MARSFGLQSTGIIEILSMGFESAPSVEKMGEGRSALLAMEAEGRYVFHGSEVVLDKLTPRQAETYNPEIERNESDGEPAVCATTYADFAIFRALINGRDLTGESYSEFGTREDGTLFFRTTRNLLENAQAKKGLVYVFNRSRFSPLEDGGSEMRSTNEEIPMESVEVTFGDLPSNIEIID